MILVLTMAGRYQRFTDEGYKTPKYLLPWGGRTVLWTVLSELTRNHEFGEVYLIGNHRDAAFMPHVRAIMRDCGVSRENLFLVSDTTGQAETASAALGLLPQESGYLESPVVFHNVDTILYGRSIAPVSEALREYDGFIDVFSSHRSDYSYVLTDKLGRVQEIAEKIMLSELATSGFYGFRSAEVYLNYFDPSADIYISSVYKRMIEAGSVLVVGNTHHESDTLVLGTPSEYLNASLLQFP